MLVDGESVEVQADDVNFDFNTDFALFYDEIADAEPDEDGNVKVAPKLVLAKASIVYVLVS